MVTARNDHRTSGRSFKNEINLRRGYTRFKHLYDVTKDAWMNVGSDIDCYIGSYVVRNGQIYFHT